MASFSQRRPKSGIFDKSLTSPRGEVSLSAFALLFSEMVQYHQNKVDSVNDLEKRLEEAGYGVGLRFAEMVGIREKSTKRETRLVNMLQYIQMTVWKYLFNKVADSLERSTENEDEYMIHECAPITNAFTSVPPQMGHLNCAAYLAGMIAGILDCSKFNAKVSAHLVSNPDGFERTVFLIKFSSEVMSRERKFGV